MLKHFDKVCRENDITYFAVFGTAIGTIRHQGFIPWDDDIDLGVMLEDYYKLISLPASVWGEEYEFVKGDDDNQIHHSTFARLYKKGTVLEPEWRDKYCKIKNNPENKKMPIWIDIFVFNKVPSEKNAGSNNQKKQLYSVNYIGVKKLYEGKSERLHTQKDREYKETAIIQFLEYQ